MHPDYNNWAPRVGLAYQVLPKTVIRAGYGISYVQFNRMGGENLLAYNGPIIVDAAIDQLATQPICASAAAAAGSCFRSTAQGFPNELRIAASLQHRHYAGALHPRRQPHRLRAELALHHPARTRAKTCCSTSPTSAITMSA